MLFSLSAVPSASVSASARRRLALLSYDKKTTPQPPPQPNLLRITYINPHEEEKKEDFGNLEPLPNLEIFSNNIINNVSNFKNINEIEIYTDYLKKKLFIEFENNLLKNCPFKWYDVPKIENIYNTIISFLYVKEINLDNPVIRDYLLKNNVFNYGIKRLKILNKKIRYNNNRLDNSYNNNNYDTCNRCNKIKHKKNLNGELCRREFRANPYLMSFTGCNALICNDCLKNYYFNDTIKHKDLYCPKCFNRNSLHILHDTDIKKSIICKSYLQNIVLTETQGTTIQSNNTFDLIFKGDIHYYGCENTKNRLFLVNDRLKEKFNTPNHFIVKLNMNTYLNKFLILETRIKQPFKQIFKILYNQYKNKPILQTYYSKFNNREIYSEYIKLLQINFDKYFNFYRPTEAKKTEIYKKQFTNTIKNKIDKLLNL